MQGLALLFACLSVIAVAGAYTLESLRGPSNNLKRGEGTDVP